MKDLMNNPRSTAPTVDISKTKQQKQLFYNPALTDEEKTTLMLNQANELKKMLDFFGIEDGYVVPYS
uniref:Transposase n=1 Tax=Strongyloides venezuelensis TaxID=75913 RepID=A0A0K0G5S9_STRVS